MDAFVYLRVRPGVVEDAVLQLQATRGVRAAVTVVGDWDVLAAAQGPDLLSIAEVVVRQIHRIDGIERTVTAPVVPGDVVGLAGGGLTTPVPMQQPGDACYVHIRTEPGRATTVAESLTMLDEVSGVALIAGAYDVIAEIPFPWERAARVVVEHIQPIAGVRSTKTLVAVPYLEPEDEDRDQFSAWT